MPLDGSSPFTAGRPSASPIPISSCRTTLESSRDSKGFFRPRRGESRSVDSIASRLVRALRSRAVPRRGREPSLELGRDRLRGGGQGSGARGSEGAPRLGLREPGGGRRTCDLPGADLGAPAAPSSHGSRGAPPVATSVSGPRPLSMARLGDASDRGHRPFPGDGGRFRALFRAGARCGLRHRKPTAPGCELGGVAGLLSGVRRPPDREAVHGRLVDGTVRARDLLVCARPPGGLAVDPAAGRARPYGPAPLLRSLVAGLVAGAREEARAGERCDRDRSALRGRAASRGGPALGERPLQHLRRPPRIPGGRLCRLHGMALPERRRPRRACCRHRCSLRHLRRRQRHPGGRCHATVACR